VPDGEGAGERGKGPVPRVAPVGDERHDRQQDVENQRHRRQGPVERGLHDPGRLARRRPKRRRPPRRGPGGRLSVLGPNGAAYRYWPVVTTRSTGFFSVLGSLVSTFTY